MAAALLNNTVLARWPLAAHLALTPKRLPCLPTLLFRPVMTHFFMKRFFRHLFVMLALLLGATACRQPQPAPDLAFALIDGRSQSLQALRGQVTLVVFWATSCSACVAEMPLLAQTQQQYQARGYRTLAVAMSYDRIDYVRNFARSRQLPFDVAMDHDGQLAQHWQVRATPTSFLLNRQGQIVQRHVGLIDAKQLHTAIEQALSKP